MKLISRIFRISSITIILTLITVFTTPYTKIYAQNDNVFSDIKWDKNTKYTLFNESLKTLKVDDQNIYYFFSNVDGKPMPGIPPVYEKIVKYNRQSETIDILPLKLKTDDTNRVRLNVIAIDSLLHIVSYFNNKDHKKVYIFDETANINTLTFNNDLHKISEINYNDMNIKNSNEIFIEIKDDDISDKSRIKLNYFFESKNENIAGYENFDKNFTSLARYQNSINKLIGVPNYAFDSENNLYTIEREFKKGTNFNRTLSEVYLVYYPKVGSYPTKRKLILDNKLITEQTLSIDNNNQVICAGVFSKIQHSSALGAFTIKFEPHLSNEGFIHIVDFDTELITRGHSKNDSIEIAKKIIQGKEFDDFYGNVIHKLHYTANGGFYMIVEKRFTNLYSNGIQDNYYGDIYILAFNNDGSMSWVQKQFRDQTIENEDSYYQFLANSYIDFRKNDDIMLIFNSLNSKNLLKTKAATNSNSNFILINKNGTKSSYRIISDYKFAMSFCPSFSYPIDEYSYSVFRLNNYVNMLNFTQNFGTLKLKQQ